MPFGISTAQAFLQRALDMVLTQFKWKTCLVYLNDVIIYSNRIKDHIERVDEILTAFNDAGVTLKMSVLHKEIRVPWALQLSRDARSRYNQCQVCHGRRPSYQ